MYNTIHKADIVITGDVGRYVIWASNNVIANVNLAGLNLIVAGASASQLSVYNAETEQFLTGTLDQLVNQSKEA
tara:strand:- start:2130 stop:2351 length:222 start_codon:yes stop_codon:yes gene_type:complete